MTEGFLYAILPMGLAGTLSYALLALLRPLFSRLGAKWRKAALLACAALFLLPLPLLAFAVPEDAGALAAAPSPVYSAGKALGQAAWASPQRPATSQNLAAQATPVLPRAAADEPQRAAPAFGGASLPQLAASLYCTGAAAVLALCAVRYRGLMRRLQRAARPETDSETLDKYGCVCRELGIKKAPALLVSGKISAPVLAGVWRSRILLPEEKMQAKQLEFALRHELNHYKNGDLAFKYLLVLVGVLHWYSPAAHLLRQNFAEACEQSCDEAVTARLPLGERKQYAAVLLDFAGPAPVGLVTAFASPAKRLHIRLRRLMRPAQPRRVLRAACFALICPMLALALLAGCSLVAGASDGSAASVPAQSAPVLSGATQAETGSAPPDASVPAASSVSMAPPATPAMASLAVGSEVPDYVGMEIESILWGENVGFTVVLDDALSDAVSQSTGALEGIFAASLSGDGSLVALEAQGVVAVQRPAAGQVWDGGPIELEVPVRLEDGTEGVITCVLTYYMSSDPAPNPAEKLLLPVPEGASLGRSFGNQHRGLDFKAEAGADIVATGTGTVITAENHYSYGNYVVIDHGGGLQTLYAHCNTLLVQTGQSVNAGDVIATVGNTGNVSGTLCHFEVQQDSQPQNPEEYISMTAE